MRNPASHAAGAAVTNRTVPPAIYATARRITAHNARETRAAVRRIAPMGKPLTLRQSFASLVAQLRAVHPWVARLGATPLTFLRGNPPEPDEVPFPDPDWLEGPLASLLIELEKEHPGLIERVRERQAEAVTRAEVSRIRGPSATPAIKRTLAMGLKWLGGVSLFAEAAWGPLERRKKRRKRDI